VVQEGANQESAEQPAETPAPVAAAETSTPAPKPAPAAAHGAEEPPADPLEKLSASGKELLDASMDVLKEFSPEASALDGIPQVIIEKQHALAACQLMKDDPRINGQMLLCLACVDFSEYFELIYVLQSLEPERTVVLRTNIPYSDATVSSVSSVWKAADWYEREAHDLFGVDFDATISSVSSVWKAADWYEREAHDLFGVDFDGHPDPSPLLLYDGFEGFPGRKEFPFNEYQEF